VIMLDDLPQVEREFEELKERLARAKGRDEEGMNRIRKDFGAKTLEEAEELLAQKAEERHAASARYLKAFKKFKRELRHVKEKIDGAV
jgi:response regulator of citrate/malate metabolism